MNFLHVLKEVWMMDVFFVCWKTAGQETGQW